LLDEDVICIVLDAVALSEFAAVMDDVSVGMLPVAESLEMFVLEHCPELDAGSDCVKENDRFLDNDVE
jgi:hypothetical protein